MNFEAGPPGGRHSISSLVLALCTAPDFLAEGSRHSGPPPETGRSPATHRGWNYLRLTSSRAHLARRSVGKRVLLG